MITLFYTDLLKLEGTQYIFSQEIFNSLHQLARTGYVDRGIENPETVGEHTDELVILAHKYFRKIKDLDVMMIIHDWPESDEKVGDLRTDKNCPADKRISGIEKYLREREAMKKICSKLGKQGVYFFSLWEEFEKQETHRAKIAKQLDKFQMVMKAIEYQATGQGSFAQEFIHSESAKLITDPRLKRAFKKAIKSLK